MDWSVIQDLFLARLLTLESQFPVICANNIALPNRTFEPGNKPLWIEYSMNSGELFWETETQTMSYGIINYVINTRQNTGTDRIYNIASRIAGLFIMPDGTKWCSIGNGISIYLQSLDILPVIVVNEVFKMNVRLSVSIYNE